MPASAAVPVLTCTVTVLVPFVGVGEDTATAGRSATAARGWENRFTWGALLLWGADKAALPTLSTVALESRVWKQGGREL
jgi:hypothetical protein